MLNSPVVCSLRIQRKNNNFLTSTTKTVISKKTVIVGWNRQTCRLGLAVVETITQVQSRDLTTRPRSALSLSQLKAWKIKLNRTTDQTRRCRINSQSWREISGQIWVSLRKEVLSLETIRKKMIMTKVSMSFTKAVICFFENLEVWISNFYSTQSKKI